ncbi:hypothetical protein Bca52824_055027 [Brassica carinata]|uniref:Exocyst subunit Exo70 family protein n=1 Tax=Brassica carinata TaxID=52824 RepID=A0A8X7R938_BRACI|nr:hypothetical protein Bca52824_055027 [Brassica carinata]
MDWATLNTNIKKWVRVMRSIVQVYLVSEKSLNDQIFGEESSVTCFVDTVKAPVMQLLNFGEAVSLGPRQPEKLLRILEMYELASELLPEIDVLFSDSQLGSSLRGEYREVMRRLGNARRRSSSSKALLLLMSPLILSLEERSTRHELRHELPHGAGRTSARLLTRFSWSMMMWNISQYHHRQMLSIRDGG